MRATQLLGLGFICGLLCGCGPLLEVEVPETKVKVTLTLPDSDAKPPKNPRMVCKWTITIVGGGVSLVDGSPQKKSIDQMQAGAVIFEFKEERQVECKRLKASVDDADGDQQPPPSLKNGEPMLIQWSH